MRQKMSTFQKQLENNLVDVDSRRGIVKRRITEKAKQIEKGVIDKALWMTSEISRQNVWGSPLGRLMNKQEVELCMEFLEVAREHNYANSYTVMTAPSLTGTWLGKAYSLGKVGLGYGNKFGAVLLCSDSRLRVGDLRFLGDCRDDDTVAEPRKIGKALNFVKFGSVPPTAKKLRFGYLSHEVIIDPDKDRDSRAAVSFRNIFYPMDIKDVLMGNLSGELIAKKKVR